MNHKKIFLIVLFVLNFALLNTAEAAAPSPVASWNSSCAIKVIGTSPTWSSIDIPKLIACYSGSGYQSLNISLWTPPEGLTNTYFYMQDVSGNTINTNVKSNYLLDISKPECKITSVRLHWIENQYYTNGRIYYRGNKRSSWKIEVNVRCYDKYYNYGNGNISWLSSIEFPTLLWVSQSSKTFFSPVKTSSVDTKLTYNWDGTFNDTVDILANIIAEDKAWNRSNKITGSFNVYLNNSSTAIKTGATSLILTPDSTAPSVTISGFKARQWNNHSTSNSYVSVTNNRYFGALSNRQVQIPTISDAHSGLPDYKIFVERYDNKSSYKSYSNTNGSNYGWNSVKTLNAYSFQHDFRDVSQKWDYTSGWYRAYDWYVQTNFIDGRTQNNYLCDMVDNCTYIAVADFRVVANKPDINKTQHNLWSTFTWNSANLSDKYDVDVRFKDVYNNDIVPVSGVKSVKITNHFTNTLGNNQITNPGSWNGASITFSPSLDTDTNYKKYSKTFTTKSSFEQWKMSVDVKSRVPTYNEYITAADNPGGASEKLYGSDTSVAKLKYDLFQIEVLRAGSSIGVWESTLQLPSSDFRFNPILSFNYISDIYPLVEWQTKNLNIKKVQTENVDYDLDLTAGTGNQFLQITKASLNNGNSQEATWDIANEYNKYLVTNSVSNSISHSLWSHDWIGTMNYTTNSNVYKLLPQSIGWISDDNNNIALYTTLKYKLGGSTVTLPWIQTGFKDFGIHDNNDFITNPADPDYPGSNQFADGWLTFAEIEVTWITQIGTDGNVTTNNATTEFGDFSELWLADLRATVKKNVSLLLKWETVSDGKINNNITIDTFNNLSKNGGLSLQWWDVVYIDATDNDGEWYNVTIDCWNTCAINGKKTIIVENGNLTLKSDLYYTDENSVLWIILLGNEDNGNNSQLRISEGITNGLWIVYADGPVISVNDLWQKYATQIAIEDGDLRNQLYWKGSFLTRNTIWWSISDINGICPYGTPHYENGCTQEISQAYDLIYLRRYARVHEFETFGSSNYPMWAWDPYVPKDYGTYNTKISWERVVQQNWAMTSWNSNLIKDDNFNSPFILDFDTKIQSNPPYGFEQ